MKRLIVAILSTACLALPAWAESGGNPLARGDQAGFRVACKNHYILITPCEVGSPEDWAWRPAGTMNVGRAFHTASLLVDGTVLVAGGLTGATSDLATRSAEIYDPRTGEWRLTGGMSVARYLHVAIPLMDGNVMALGGFHPYIAGPNAPFAEIYDASRGAWRPASAGEYRSEPSATMLADGRILISGGGSGTFEPLSSAVIYEPASDSFRPTGSLAHARMGHYSARLDDGKVLVFGGVCDSYIRAPISDVEVFDPLTETWSPGADLDAPRDGSTTALVPGGSVVVIGGTAWDPRGESLYAPCPGSRINEAAFAPPAAYANMDMFDAGQWVPGPAMAYRRFGHASTQLFSGHLVTTGGVGWETPAWATTEILDPLRSRWTETAPLAQARAFHAATRLADGRVLVTGGFVFGDAGVFYCTTCTGPSVNRAVIRSAEVLGPPQ